MKFVDLVIGVKRRTFRVNDQFAAQADEEYRVARKPALESGAYTCIHCGYNSRSNTEIHHWDDDHHNNNQDNLKCNCKICHPHHHVGQASTPASVNSESQTLGNSTYMAVVPEMEAPEFGLFLRAIGMAMNDPATKPVALEMLHRLGARSKNVQATWRSLFPADFAAAMASLSDNQYETREKAVKDLRLLFRPDVLKRIGGETLADYPSMGPATWEVVGREVKRKISSQ